MLKRTSLNLVNQRLQKNSNWKVLDIGCGYTASKHASVIADVQDLSNFYKGRKFVKINEEKLPFNDNEAHCNMIQKEANDVAAFIVSPIAGKMGVIPPKPGFLEALR